MNDNQKVVPGKTKSAFFTEDRRLPQQMLKSVLKNVLRLEVNHSPVNCSKNKKAISSDIQSAIDVTKVQEKNFNMNIAHELSKLNTKVPNLENFKNSLEKIEKSKKTEKNLENMRKESFTLQTKLFKKNQQKRLIEMSESEMNLNKKRSKTKKKYEFNTPDVSFMYKPSINRLYS